MNAESTRRDVDLLIRTSGEKRLSDFLLWECAYAELHFTETSGPTSARATSPKIASFHARERRFAAFRRPQPRRFTAGNNAICLAVVRLCLIRYPLRHGPRECAKAGGFVLLRAATLLQKRQRRRRIVGKVEQ